MLVKVVGQGWQSSVFGECFLPRSRPGACKDAGNDNVDIRVWVLTPSTQ